jgi:hypothetical protein
MPSSRRQTQRAEVSVHSTMNGFNTSLEPNVCIHSLWSEPLLGFNQRTYVAFFFFDDLLDSRRILFIYFSQQLIVEKNTVFFEPYRRFQ